MAIVIHNINGNFYAYEHYREGDKVVSVYLYPVSSEKKINIVSVDEFEGGGHTWLGMNYYAAKELKIKYPYSENTIVIAKTSPKEDISKSIDREKRNEIIRHEIAEREHMKNEHMKYDEAHKLATKEEKIKRRNTEGSGGYEKPYTFKGERKPTYEGKKVLGTVKKGKVPITSKKQMGKLHHEKIDHTHYTFDEQGNIKSKRRHVY